MKSLAFTIGALLTHCILSAQALVGVPAGFVEVQAVIPDVVYEPKYATDDNFAGRVIAGYEHPRAYLTEAAALALSKVQAELRGWGLGLKVFDAYRPQRAVNDFLTWSEDPLALGNKTAFFPTLDKKDLFPLQYIAERSSHSRGSTVDLTLINLNDKSELDMGGPFDFFGPLSWPSYLSLEPAPRAHRMLLQTLMVKYGFKPYDHEWWHFTLKDEPFPDTYFDFPLE